MVQVAKRPVEAPVAILVVEDEALVRMMVAEGLRDCGFRVIEAASAPEAIARLKADPDIGVVFSDVHMPGGMDGIGLAHWLREHAPDVPILLTSAAARPASDPCGPGPIVPKPYRLATIVHRIRALTGRAEGPAGAMGGGGERLEGVAAA